MEEVIKEKEEKCHLENIRLVEHMKCSHIVDCSVVQYSTKPKEAKYISFWICLLKGVDSCLCVLLLNIRLKTKSKFLL